jgi:predicted ATPase
VKIQSLHIKNFKSIVDLTLTEPNNFTVFVGPNGAGKSNIFEALEFMKYIKYGDNDDIRAFGGAEALVNRNSNDSKFGFTIEIDDIVHKIENDYQQFRGVYAGLRPYDEILANEIENWAKTTYNKNYSRIFIKNKDKEITKFEDSYKLSFSASNLEKVLKRILQDEGKKEEILEWLQLLIPEFQHIEIDSDNKLKIREKYSNEPFEKDLISDGTYNILALLTAVYQSDEPQFLCIEEPENGLHPEVIKELIGFFRAICQEKGHYIWLNTHSQSLVSQLMPEEIILVNKKQGATVIKQLKGKDLHGLTMDDAWLTNALGGGLTW